MAFYEITFRDEIEVDSEEEAYDYFLKYLAECVHNQDVTAFQFDDISKYKEALKCC
jgi:hypothetical protein